MIKNHSEQLNDIKLKLGQKILERKDEHSLLGINVDTNLKWNSHITNILSACYYKLTILRKLKNFTNFRLRKTLAESLIMSKIDFNDYIYAPITQVQLRKLQRLQLATASFVYGRYATLPDITNLKWLLMKERRAFNMLKQVFKAIHYSDWPEINKLERKTFTRTLRNSSEILLKQSNVKGTFQESASDLFNKLPKDIRNVTELTPFCSLLKQHLLNEATSRV